MAKVGKVCIRPKWFIRPELIPTGFCSMGRLGVFLFPPPDWMLVHRRVNVTPIIKFAGTHWYTCEYKVGLNPDRSIKSKSALTMRQAPLQLHQDRTI